MAVSRLKMGIRIPLWGAGLVATAAAHSATRSTLDLSAGLGAASNPSLQADGKSSVFGRFSALGRREWRSDRTTTSLSAFVENTTYVRGYGSKQIFDLKGHVGHALSPTLSIFADLGFQGDFAGQLSNRFASATPDLGPLQPNQPPQAVVDDPTLVGFDGRQYRVSAQAGLSMLSSARSSVSLSAGAQRNFANGSQSNSNYNSYFGSGSYDYQFSEHTSGGFSTGVQYQDYKNGSASTVFNPRLTARHQFSDQIESTGSVGLLLTRQQQPDGNSAKSLDPSFSISLCRRNERDRFCGRASRDARNSLGGGLGTLANSLVISTLVGVDYSRRLDSNQSIQASLSANRYSTELSGEDDVRTTYLTFLTGYDRKIRHRLAVGVSASARKLFQAGTDPKADITATGYLRYRLGDIQ